jgi:hypothetical protein
MYSYMRGLVSRPAQTTLRSLSAPTDSANGILQGKKDKYRGMTVSEDSVAQDREQFTRQLDESLKSWQAEGIQGIWLKLSNKNAHLIDIAVNRGQFNYHHAKEGYVMLTRWLSSGLNKMPSYATHYVGVGGLVLS